MDHVDGGSVDHAPAWLAPDDVHPELRSRILAATAHADVRMIRRRQEPQGDEAPEDYEVFALTGDRLVRMLLALRSDGSVAESTDSVPVADIIELELQDRDAHLTFRTATGPRSLVVPAQVARAINRPSDTARPLNAE